MHAVEFPHMPPSMCFICRSASAERYADTMQTFDPAVQTDHNGRKYICSGCAISAADAVGAFDEHKARIDAAEARVKEIETRMEAYAALEAAIGQIPAPLVPVVQPDSVTFVPEPAVVEEENKPKRAPRKKTTAPKAAE